MRYPLLFLLLVTALVTGGCVSGPQKAVVITTQPTPLPSVPATTATPSDRDPIIGAWDNGMVFYGNGTVGSDGFTTWRANRDEKNSYFVIRDEPSTVDRSRNVTSSEWIFVPGSDCIYRRGFPTLVRRLKE
ncbi:MULTISPECIES: hypothetical protein [unclassified Methanoregula]|uniref:hypothetical protein n=1 Tax=unclassified Methanoregula TaxID=2649730 RepID=UPI0009D171AD|nr:MULTISPECIES: hypothetical protein [unclassified Methanoregula]OPX64522.1 MAG: hypothetical protein A4E33_00872 [Methanoregula sp. PtaB.Bin085]OPY37291.1 MAG: hypothetical protein A4E34_00085 [Methanoregula sp. PtaU1.Bin006]